MVEPQKSKPSLSATPEKKFLGVESIRFLNLSDEKKEDLTCPICHSIYWNPLACNECENIFCSECINHWRLSSLDCPLCQKFFKEKKIPRIISNMLSRLQVHCENQSEGCEEILSYDKTERHQEHECEFKVFTCSNFDCGSSLKRKEFELHRFSCPHIILQCQWCEVKIKNMYLKDHEELCEFKIMKCSNENCPTFYFKREHEDHIKNCAYNLITCSFCSEKFPRMDVCIHEMICDAKPSLCKGCGLEMPLREIKAHEAKCELIEVCCSECGAYLLRGELQGHDKLACLVANLKTVKRENIQREMLVESLQESLIFKGEEIRALSEQVFELKGKLAKNEAWDIEENKINESKGKYINWPPARKRITRRESIKIDSSLIGLEPELTIPESFSYGQITTILPLNEDIVLIVFDESRISAWNIKDKQEIGHSNKHPYYEKILNLTLFRFNDGRNFSGNTILQSLSPDEPSINLLEMGYMLIASGTQASDIFIYDLEFTYSRRAYNDPGQKSIVFNQRASFQQGASFNFFREEENQLPVSLLDLGDYVHVVSTWGVGNECLKVWNPADFSQENFKLSHEKSITALTLLETGKRFISASLDYTIKVWLVIANKQGTFISLINKQTLNLASPIYDVLASSLQEDVVYVNKRNCIEIWNLKSKSLDYISGFPAGGENSENITDFLLIEKKFLNENVQGLVLAKGDSAIFSYSDGLKRSKMLRVVDESKHFLKNLMAFDEAMMPLIMLDEGNESGSFLRRRLFLMPTGQDEKVSILSIGERAESFTLMRLTTQQELMNLALAPPLEKENFDLLD